MSQAPSLYNDNPVRLELIPSLSSLVLSQGRKGWKEGPCFSETKTKKQRA